VAERQKDWENERWKETWTEKESRDRGTKRYKDIKMDRHMSREIHRWINMKNMTLSKMVFAKFECKLC
jgi:hypothetical protein